MQLMDEQPVGWIDNGESLSMYIRLTRRERDTQTGRQTHRHTQADTQLHTHRE